MQRIARGDPDAVSELYDRFGAMVYRMAYQLMPTKAEAEDAVQEVFVRLWQSAGRYNPDRAALVTWVMIITRRYLVDQLRRMKVRPRPTTLDAAWQASDASAKDPDDRMIRSERQQKLLERISTLPELQRQVIERAYLGGKTLRDISEELDRPLGTVKSALSRALAILRERVPQDEDME